MAGRFSAGFSQEHISDAAAAMSAIGDKSLNVELRLGRGWRVVRCRPEHDGADRSSLDFRDSQSTAGRPAFDVPHLLRLC